MLTILEKKIEDYPCMISLAKSEDIIAQMKNCVCIIKASNSYGSGFFTKIEFNGKNINCLVTNSHVIQKHNSHTYEKEIIIYIKDKVYPIIINDSRKIYYNEEIDVEFIEIKEEIECTYLGLDNSLEAEYKYKSIYIIQNLKESGIFVSYGIIKGLYDHGRGQIMHLCDTQFGTSGSPIISLESLKVIGIHKGAAPNNLHFNIGY